MPGETELHKTLKKEACRWLYRMGYRCIAAEVRLPPLGIIDAVGTGMFRPYHNYLCIPRELPQVCFIECKASRSDFLRDHEHDGQMHAVPHRAPAAISAPRAGGASAAPPDRRAWASSTPACMQPMANLHYILAPAGLIQKRTCPRAGGC